MFLGLGVPCSSSGGGGGGWRGSDFEGATTALHVARLLLLQWHSSQLAEGMSALARTLGPSCQSALKSEAGGLKKQRRPSASWPRRRLCLNFGFSSANLGRCGGSGGWVVVVGGGRSGRRRGGLREFSVGGEIFRRGRWPQPRFPHCMRPGSVCVCVLNPCSVLGKLSFGPGLERACAVNPTKQS